MPHLHNAENYLKNYSAGGSKMEYPINQNSSHLIITDNGSNMVRAFQNHFEEKDDDDDNDDPEI